MTDDQEDEEGRIWGEGQLHVMPYTAYYPWTDCHGSKITAVDLQGDIIVVGQCSAIFYSNFCFIFLKISTLISLEVAKNAPCLCLSS